MIDFIKNEIIHPKSRQKVLKYEPVLSLGFTAWSRVSVGSERVEREGKGRGGLEEGGGVMFLNHFFPPY